MTVFKIWRLKLACYKKTFPGLLFNSYDVIHAKKKNIKKII